MYWGKEGRVGQLADADVLAGLMKSFVVMVTIKKHKLCIHLLISQPCIPSTSKSVHILSYIHDIWTTPLLQVTITTATRWHLSLKRDSMSVFGRLTSWHGNVTQHKNSTWSSNQFPSKSCIKYTRFSDWMCSTDSKRNHIFNNQLANISNGQLAQISSSEEK